MVLKDTREVSSASQNQGKVILEGCDRACRAVPGHKNAIPLSWSFQVDRAHKIALACEAAGLCRAFIVEN